MTDIASSLEQEFADASQAEAYLCGSPLMIDACSKDLRDKGMAEGHVFYDKFA